MGGEVQGTENNIFITIQKTKEIRKQLLQRRAELNIIVLILINICVYNHCKFTFLGIQKYLLSMIIQGVDLYFFLAALVRCV